MAIGDFFPSLGAPTPLPASPSAAVINQDGTASYVPDVGNDNLSTLTSSTTNLDSRLDNLESASTKVWTWRVPFNRSGNAVFRTDKVGDFEAYFIATDDYVQFRIYEVGSSPKAHWFHVRSGNRETDEDELFSGYDHVNTFFGASAYHSQSPWSDKAFGFGTGMGQNNDSISFRYMAAPVVGAWNLRIELSG